MFPFFRKEKKEKSAPRARKEKGAFCPNQLVATSNASVPPIFFFFFRVYSSVVAESIASVGIEWCFSLVCLDPRPFLVVVWKPKMRGKFDPVHTNGSEHGCINNLVEEDDLPTPSLSPTPKLLRKLTRLDGIAIIVGIIIGSGIFASVGNKSPCH